MKKAKVYMHDKLSGVLFENEIDFHSKCSKVFFASDSAPILDYRQEDLLKLAEKVVISHQTITGVQPKLSLGIQLRKSSTAIIKTTRFYCMTI